MPAGVKYAYGVWNRCGGEDLFHFTWCEASNITICRANYFTVSEASDFTFCLDKTLWILHAERVKARSTALPAADEAVLWAGRNNEHCEALQASKATMFLTERVVGSSPTWGKNKKSCRKTGFFVLFNIYHSLNGGNFQWFAPLRHFLEKLF